MIFLVTSSFDPSIIGRFLFLKVKFFPGISNFYLCSRNFDDFLIEVSNFGASLPTEALLVSKFQGTKQLD